MSIEAINWVFELQDITPTEKLVMLALANRANDKTHLAWPSWTRLTRDTSLSRKTIYRTLNSLYQKGYLIKTGDTVRQVSVHKLCGVLSKENLQKLKSINKKLSTGGVTMTPVSPRHQCHHDTTTSVTMTPLLVSPRHLEPSLESPKEPKGKNQVFLPIKTQVQNQLKKHDLEPTDDIVAQIEFYVDSKPEEQEDKLIRIAVSLHKKGKWNIPNGYNGITSATIKADEEEYEREKSRLNDETAAQYPKLIAEAFKRAPLPAAAIEQAKETRKPSANSKFHMRNILMSLTGASTDDLIN